MDFIRTLGDTVKKARKRLGLTQLKAAEICTSCSDFAKPKSEQEENRMEITIKINGRMVSVEVNDEVAECYDQGRRKAENLYHEKRPLYRVSKFTYSLLNGALRPTKKLPPFC